MPTTTLRDFREGDHVHCERILRALPDWFGIESSLVQYVQDTIRMRTWMAHTDGEPSGFLSIHEHNPRSAEIHVMAVHPKHHRRGIGRLMIETAQRDLRSRGFEYLQVKTMGSSRPSDAYAMTRRFYEAMGFAPLEEFPNLCPGNPCLLFVKRL